LIGTIITVIGGIIVTLISVFGPSISANKMENKTSVEVIQLIPNKKLEQTDIGDGNIFTEDIHSKGNVKISTTTSK